MNRFLLTVVLFLSFTVSSQNIVYFERSNDISFFSVGQGNVQIHTIGVHPLMEVFISYDQNVSGNAVNTGYIPLSSATLSDVFGTELNAIGIMPSGDTIIKTHQILTDQTSYEISSVTSNGLSPDGQWNSQAWQINISFTGPDMNCDAHSIDDFLGFGTGVSSVNNQLDIIENNAGFMYWGFGRVLFNQDQSFFSYNVFDLSSLQNPTHTTGLLLNAYIPRVVTRPSDNSACDGVVNFERVSMVNDIQLSYAINGANFTAFSSDQLTNVCASDTIEIIGISASIFPADTLVKTVYILESVLNSQAVDFDLSRINIALNVNGPNNNCLNEITIQNSNTNGVSPGNAIVFDEDMNQMEITLWDNNPITIAQQCQQKYRFFTHNYGDLNLINYFTYTILDENNFTHGNLFDMDIENVHTVLGDCASNVHVINSGVSIPGSLSMTRWDISAGSFQGTQVGNFIPGPPQEYVYQNVCSALYSFNYDNQQMELHVITDSLQKRTHKNESFKIPSETGTVNYFEVYTLNDIDTLFHYWEECTNDYSLPFNSISFDDNILLNAINFNNSIDFIQYECNFAMTQNSANITLPYREVLAPKYQDAQSSIPYIPYYIVAELYCEFPGKVLEKRRRIILGPDGQIQDLYDNTLGLQNHPIADFKIYPNPANTVLNISANEMINTATITDLNGRIVLKMPVNAFQESIQVSSIPTGNYILSIEQNGYISRKLFSKQ